MNKIFTIKFPPPAIIVIYDLLMKMNVYVSIQR